MRNSCAASLAALLLLTSGCTFSRVVGELDRESPPQDLGRPAIVRYTARTGAWLGGFAGGLASLVTLPLTYPVTLIADEPLGYAKDEFLYWGLSAGASTGHFMLGAPVDTLDWVFRRAWTDPAPDRNFDFTPVPRPADHVLVDDQEGADEVVEATAGPETQAVDAADSGR